ncbi:hypothetical protein ACFX2J_020282 [Malus domestica]
MQETNDHPNFKGNNKLIWDFALVLFQYQDWRFWVENRGRGSEEAWEIVVVEEGQGEEEEKESGGMRRGKG